MLFATCWSLPGTLAAEREPALDIQAEGVLAPGPAQLRVVVQLGDAGGQPLLLDVASEGEALQVVRGRFLRADAKLNADGTLQFSVPIVVRAQGNAIVRAQLLTYRCAESCRELRAAAQRTLTVAAAPGRSGNAP